ncbi:MAG: mannosyltransferase family protein, partial [Solirubrobacteraceae bacterium]
AVAEPVSAGRLESTRVRTRRLSVAARQELLWISVIYLSARGMLLLGAYLEGSFGHHNFLGELANWDGLWYRRLANHGYPTQVEYGQTTLGFFPLFPITLWLLEPVFTVFTSHNQIWAATVSGLLISCVGGWVATVLVHRLADGWWGRAAARRATILFIVFPGSVVFSMVYSEALLMPLAAGCLWALQKRRWVLAGVLAGFGSAVQPVGLMLPVMCAASALWYLHRSGWRLREAKRCLIAPVLSAAGVVCFMAFLWIWTGNPFANYIAQHHGWSEKTDPLALVHTATRMAPAFDPSHFNQPTVNLNLVVGLIGAVILAVQLVLLWHSRREVSLEAIVWTLGIAFFAYTSEFVPPNPRLLITAFPALMVLGRYVQGKWFAVLVFVNVWLLAGLSLLTFVGHALRP